MATFLDIGIVENFSIVFVFILIFTIIYALLEYSKPFGSANKGLHGLIAIAISFLLVISKAAVLMINFMTSWFVVLFLFIVFSLFAIRIFGVSESDTVALIKNTQLYPYLIVLIVIIGIAGIASVYGQSLLEKGTGVTPKNVTDGDLIPSNIDGGSTKTTSFGENVLNTLVHPKVLGFIAIMVLGTLTLAFLTKLT
ncbi:MAG: hypothetical protein KJ583_01685 [Nanoarchaeota archaeon]|nr:hypothetical protein [Nanoarchaeota archaeon]MBU1269702.1 hypothetical protein [Nanoarchaeota archaeon]MBU1604003.1 hypothetical protein [Nanoarchaeota archaeon]MBU2442520.1 hypothetical protein [Nanoarchaeota archaeon]